VTVFWNIAPCNPIEIDRLQLWNVGQFLPNYRRNMPGDSPPLEFEVSLKKCIHPRGTSRALQHAVKSYDMGPPALLPILRKVCCGFLSLLVRGTVPWFLSADAVWPGHFKRSCLNNKGIYHCREETTMTSLAPCWENLFAALETSFRIRAATLCTI
jgi:hypothetical protein